MCACIEIWASVSCLKCAACRLQRLTQNQSAADTLSLTNSSANSRRSGGKSVISAAKAHCRIFYHLHVYLSVTQINMIIRLINRVTWVCKSAWDHHCCIFLLINLIRGSAVGVRLTAARDHQSTYCGPLAVNLQRMWVKRWQQWLKALWVMYAVWVWSPA